MLTQSGVRSITLYDKDDLSFDYVTDETIENVSGTSIFLDNEKRPDVSFEIKKIHREVYADLKINFVLYNIQDLDQFMNIHGWCALIEFYNGDKYLYTDPLFIDITEFSTDETNKYPISMSLNRPTDNIFKIV